MSDVLSVTSDGSSYSNESDDAGPGVSMSELWESSQMFDTLLPQMQTQTQTQTEHLRHPHLTNVPSHVQHLIKCLTSETFDLNDTSAVQLFIDRYNKRREQEIQEDIVKRIVRLMRLENGMKLCRAFDDHDVQLVRTEIEDVVREYPSSKRQRIMKLAWVAYRKQFLCELVNTSLLNTSVDVNLFQKLIQKQVDIE